MKRIKQTYHIKAPIEKVWRALVDPQVIEEWGGGPAKMDEKVGTTFELWGGDIHGTNIEVVEGERLAQDWFSSDWPQPSRVSFTLSEEESGTKLVLLHTDVPDDEADDIREGWREFYLGPLKQLVEST